MVAGRKRYIERLHAVALKAPGGRGRVKREKVPEIIAEALRHLDEQRQELEAVVAGGDVMKRPVECLTPAEALARASLSGLYQLIRIVEQPVKLVVNEEEPPSPSMMKFQRLIMETAQSVNKLFIRVAEGEFRPRRPSAELLRVLAETAEEGADAKPAIASPDSE